MKRFLATAAIPAAVLGAGIFVIASPAQAAVPSCVGWRPTSSPTSIIVDNACSTSQRFKIVWRYAPDSNCKTQAGITSKGYFTPSPTGEFDRLTNC